MRSPVPTLLVALSLTSLAGSAQAEVLFVNNRTGADRNDGVVDKPLDLLTGPVRSISRALQLAEHGDTIVIANTGVPYYDNLTLQGEKHSGSQGHPFKIEGNGAVVTGAMVIPDGAWQEVADDVWKVVPYRKGHFQLIRDGKALPEVRPEPGVIWSGIPELANDEWCAWRGTVYYKAERLVEPSTLNLSIARRSCGVTVFAAHDVVIADLTIQHFRLDGVNVHDLATRVDLRNLNLIENGRAGLAVGGSSTCQLINGDVRRNRDHSILIQEASGLAVDASSLDVEPTVVD